MMRFRCGSYEREGNKKEIPNLLLKIIFGNICRAYRWGQASSNLSKSFKQSRLTINDIDLVEVNEAFAAQSLVVMKEFKYSKRYANMLLAGVILPWASNRSNRYENTGYTYT